MPESRLYNCLNRKSRRDLDHCICISPVRHHCVIQNYLIIDRNAQLKLQVSHLFHFKITSVADLKLFSYQSRDVIEIRIQRSERFPLNRKRASVRWCEKFLHAFRTRARMRRRRKNARSHSLYTLNTHVPHNYCESARREWRKGCLIIYLNKRPIHAEVNRLVIATNLLIHYQPKNR